MTLYSPVLSSSYTHTAGAGGMQVGDSVYYYGTSNIDYRLRNDAAGRTFELLNRYAPTAAAKFGFTRSQVLAWVDQSSSSCTGDYSVSTDRLNLTEGCLPDGVSGPFLVMHEYGHAYMYKALEAPRTPYSCPSMHGMYTQFAVLECSYVEGFADFFSAWLVQALTPRGSDFSNETIESNPFPPGDGSLMEGRVAAFFLDMVDSPSDTDGIA